jgi:hypothetical protein
MDMASAVDVTTDAVADEFLELELDSDMPVGGIEEIENDQDFTVTLTDDEDGQDVTAKDDDNEGGSAL